MSSTFIFFSAISSSSNLGEKQVPWKQRCFVCTRKRAEAKEERARRETKKISCCCFIVEGYSEKPKFIYASTMVEEGNK